MQLGNVIGFLALSLEVGCIGALERRLSLASPTPFDLLALPFLLITLSTALFAESFGFIPLRPEAIVVWIVALPVFWAGGILVTQVFARRGMRPVEAPIRADEVTTLVVITFVAVLAAGADLTFAAQQHESIMRVYELTKSHITAYVASSLNDFMQGFTPLCATILIGELRWRSKWTIVLGSAMVFFLFLTGVKGMYLLPIAGGLIYRLRGTGRKRWLMEVAVGIVLMAALSLATNVVAISASTPSALWEPDTYHGAAEHTARYLWAGVLALGEQVASGGQVPEVDRNRVFAPLVNAWRRLTGTYNTSYRPEGVLPTVIDSDSESFAGSWVSNVHTIFGTLLLYRGPAEAVGVTIILGALSYLLYVWLMTSRSVWLRGCSALLLSPLLFGWFEYYYWHSIFVSAVFGATIARIATALMPVPKIIRRSFETGLRHRWPTRDLVHRDENRRRTLYL